MLVKISLHPISRASLITGTDAYGETVTLDDDAAEWIRRIMDRANRQTQASTFAYGLDGLLIQAGDLSLNRNSDSGYIDDTRLGSTTTTPRYNSFGELTGIDTKNGATSIYSFTLAYDRLGRVASKTETLQGASASYEYGYDIAGRLSTATQNGVTTTYAYDPNGNRTHVNGVLVVMAIFSLTLWLRRRSESMFLLFGLMAAVAVVRLFHHYLRDTPEWLGAMAVPAMCWLTILQVNFSLHYANRQMPKTERVLIIVGVVSSIFILICALADKFWFATTVIYGVFALLGPFLAGLVIYQLTRNMTRGNVLMIVATLFNVGFGIHDFINYQELLGFDRLYLIPLGLPLLLVAVAALLVRRFVETIANYESLNADLANRIMVRERDLAASFVRERALDQQRATAEERQRLMRDMHDGLGSHLMSTLAVMRRGTLSQAQLETIIADAIDELKLTIDSLEPVERDLLVVLGNLRYRLEPRLQAAGITLEWAVSDLPPLDYLDPSNVRSVLHIVQEAFTNTLKHANATQITLSTKVDHAVGRVMVRMTDNGESFDIEKIRNGRGLANMRDRAARLGGHVEIIPLKGGGTCVSLYLPLISKHNDK